MLRNKLITAVLLLIMALAGMAFWKARHASESHRTVETIGQQQQWMEAAFDKHLKSLVRRNGDVHLISDGFFVADAGQGLAADFVVGVNGRFRTETDHHSEMTFQVEQIEEGGIVIRYESRFDHLSFGKNLTTIDRGTMKLKWRGVGTPSPHTAR